MKSSIIVLSSLFFCASLFAQHTEKPEHNAEHGENTHEEKHKKFKVSFTLGVTHIPAAFEHGHEEKEVFVPTIGLDFFYIINHRWSMALIADVELEDYIVDFNREDLTREKAIILTLMGGYEIIPHWGLLFGGGIEFENNHNLGVLRVGTEYEFPLGRDWSFAPSFFFDYKEDFSTWALAVGIGKRF